MAASKAFREAYIGLTLVPRFGPVVLTGIETQVSYPELRSRPDMRLILHDSNGTSLVVLVEHKIDAAETVVQIEHEEHELVGQLERYLEVPDIAGVLYFRRSLKEPSQAVRAHQKYVRPTDSAHFLWWRLHDLLKQCERDSIIVRWLREGFEELGFLRPPAVIDDLYHPDLAVRERNRRALEHFLVPVRVLLGSRKWPKVWSDQKGNELKAEGHPSSPAHRITITGSNNGPFTIRVVLNVEGDYPRISAMLEQAYSAEDMFRGVNEIQGGKSSTKVTSPLLQFNSLAAILCDTAPDGISDRLMTLVTPAIDALSPP